MRAARHLTALLLRQLSLICSEGGVRWSPQYGLKMDITQPGPVLWFVTFHGGELFLTGICASKKAYGRLEHPLEALGRVRVILSNIFQACLFFRLPLWTWLWAPSCPVGQWVPFVAHWGHFAHRSRRDPQTFGMWHCVFWSLQSTVQIPAVASQWRQHISHYWVLCPPPQHTCMLENGGVSFQTAGLFHNISFMENALTFSKAAVIIRLNSILFI